MTHPTTEQRELLELAAKAAGIPVQVSSFLGREGLSHAGSVTPWNPLTDDGDAFRLAVKLGMSIDIDEHEASTYTFAGNVVPRVHAMEMWRDDKHTATRLAIVRAAAAIAKGEKV